MRDLDCVIDVIAEAKANRNSLENRVSELERIVADLVRLRFPILEDRCHGRAHD